MSFKKRFFQFLLILPITATVILLGNINNQAYGCINFWVNPSTGQQECLDGVAGTTSAPTSTNGSENNRTNPRSSNRQTQEGTVSSTTANQQYKNRRFTMLPVNQLRHRTPRASRVPQLIVTGTSIDETSSGSGVATSSEEQNQAIAPSSFGTSGVPYSTSRVLGGTSNPAQANAYARTGKLYMAFGGDAFNSICSGALIGRSLLLTAAHCIHEYGQGNAGWARKVRFVPAKDDSSEPYSSFESTQFLIPTVYYNGTDTCDPAANGIVCNNDIALIALENNSSGQQAGDLVGYYGYGWNNYSFSSPASSFVSAFGTNILAAITQLGYPGDHDLGLRMQMNNAYGSYVSANGLENTWLGSAMTGGSSGGPWLVNLGQNAIGANYGTDSVRDVIVGVTSWGYTDGITQVQGASSFGENVEYPNSNYGDRGAGNIGKLVYDACDRSSGWRLGSQGRCT